MAEARKQLPKLLNEVQRGEAIEITRRGQPVAVVVSLADFQRMAGSSDGFATDYRDWRAGIDPADLELPDDFFSDLRDRSLGREVEL